MSQRTPLSAVLVLSGLVAGSALVSAGQFQLPSEPAKQFGTGVTGAFEGWYDNPDGSHVFLVGYLNRNRSQEVDVPIGTNNVIEPGGPDMGQPSHFLPGRHTGMFTVTVPKEFRPDQKLTWTISVNGQTNQIPLRLHPDYNVSPLSDVAVGNTPPIIRLEENGAPIQGPIAAMSKPVLVKTVSMSTPLALPTWSEDDAKFSSGSNAPMRNPPPPVQLTWSLWRGPGKVTFDKAKPEVEKLIGGNVNEMFKGRSTTTAKFSAPGEYIIHLTANDFSGEGGGGEVCCWTTAMVKVTVTP